MSIKSKVQEIAQKRWNEVKSRKGFTKEDAVIYALEMIDENGYDYDPTTDEYHELITSLIGESTYKPLKETPERFLVQKMIDDEIFSRIMTANELINYIDMSDCHDEKFEIFDCDTVFGSVRKLYYKGWQPGCLIEIVDEDGTVVLRGYGEDH